MITAYVESPGALFIRKSESSCRSIAEALERFPCEHLRIEIAPGTYRPFYVPTGRTVEIVARRTDSSAERVIVKCTRESVRVWGNLALTGVILRGGANLQALDVAGGHLDMQSCVVTDKASKWDAYYRGAITAERGSVSLSECRVSGQIKLDRSTADIRRSRLDSGAAVSWVHACNESRGTVDLDTFVDAMDSADIDKTSSVWVGKVQLKKELPDTSEPPASSHYAEVMAGVATRGIEARRRAERRFLPPQPVATYASPAAGAFLRRLSEAMRPDPVSAAASDVENGDALGELGKLVGLASVKDHIQSIVALMKVGSMRRDAGLPSSPVSSHLVFAGPPGTGKTTVARLYGRILAELGVLPNGRLTEVSRVDLIGDHVGETERKTKNAFERAKGGVLLIDEAHALASSQKRAHHQDYGRQAIDTLLKLMEDHRDEVTVIVTGPIAEIDTFLQSNAGLASRFPRTIAFEPYTPHELTDICVAMAEAAGYSVADDTRAAIEQHMRTCRKPVTFGNGRYSRDVVTHMTERHAARLATCDTAPSSDELARLDPEDLRGAGHSPLRRRAISGGNRDQGQLDSVLAALDAMVGLGTIKRQFRDTITHIENATQRQKFGLAVHSPANQNLLFVGPSGTGKSTVAQLYGQLLAALGVLPQGRVRTVTRSNLVGQYVGETAIKTREELERARGGILFIDDAYSLARQSKREWDFGREAIDEIVGLIDEYAEDTIIIAAGYPTEMCQFLGMNPGLASRFPRVIRFLPYTPTQLLAMTTNAALAQDYDIAPDTADALLRHYQDLHDCDARDAGNARYAHNVLNGLIAAQSGRVIGSLDLAAHRQLTPEDLKQALDDLSAEPHEDVLAALVG